MFIKTITLNTEEFHEMQKELYFLYCLRRAGVDNWEGYDYAIDMFAEEYGDDE